MPRAFIQQGVELVKHYEGFCANAYRCPAGKLTIGELPGLVRRRAAEAELWNTPP